MFKSVKVPITFFLWNILIPKKINCQTVALLITCLTSLNEWCYSYWFYDAETHTNGQIIYIHWIKKNSDFSVLSYKDETNMLFKMRNIRNNNEQSTTINDICLKWICFGFQKSDWVELEPLSWSYLFPFWLNLNDGKFS